MAYYLKNISDKELYVPELKKNLMVGEIVEIESESMVTHLTAAYNGYLKLVDEEEFKKTLSVQEEVEQSFSAEIPISPQENFVPASQVVEDVQTQEQNQPKKRGRPKKSETLNQE